jgi:uncharacterized phage protein gp47/JayE
VNAATVNLLSRPYQQIVDDILTAMVGGVVNEQIIFDVNRSHYPLSHRATDIRSVNGEVTVPSTSATPQVNLHTFEVGIDFVFSAGDNSVAWLTGGTLPDDQSVFYVDYFRQDSTTVSPLTDLNIGSVTRTLSEAVGREIATVYQEINQAYLAGFVDTATGVSLDLVVSILGVVRRTKAFAVGLVTFFRDPASSAGSITIPQGTTMRTASGVIFETSDLATLQLGQVRIDVPVRAGDASKGSAGMVKAGEINTLEAPIAGLSRITNFDATVLGSNDETDDQLRERAKATLQGLGKGTIAALTRVVFDEVAKLNEIRDPNNPAALTSPGSVVLLVDTEPERFVSLQSSINETRAAGVLATVVARYVFFDPRMIVKIAAGMTEAGKVKLLDQIIAAIQTYVDGLKPGDPATGQKVVQAILRSVKGVKSATDIQFADVLVSRADVANPGSETLVDALLNAVSATPQGDTAALRVAIEDVLSPTFSERRIPDSTLLLGPTGQPATSQQIEAGQFQVISVVKGEKWSLALDMQPADILLMEQ